MRDDVKQPTPSHMIFFDKLRYRLDVPSHALPLKDAVDCITYPVRMLLVLQSMYISIESRKLRGEPLSEG